MKELETILNKLEEIERYNGLKGVIFILAIAVLLTILYFFLKSFINKWGERKFNRELAKYKTELHEQLGVVIVDKLSTVNQEIENLRAILDSNTQKELSYHAEKLTAHRKVYNAINIWFHELTDLHHGGVDQWDDEKLRERVAFLSQMSNQIKIEIFKLKMYSDDTELFIRVEEMYFLIVKQIYTSPKQYLLKIRAWLSDYADCKSPEALKEKIAQKDKLTNEFHSNLLKVLDEINPKMKEFHEFFRLKYHDLVTEPKGSL